MEKQQRRILVVDDNAADVKGLELVLRLDRYEVLTAGSGAGALDAVRASPPDLVLLVDTLADMSGYDVCRGIRAAEETRALPVVMMTTWSMDEARPKCRAARADGCITKPIDLNELLALVRDLLGVSDYGETLEEQRTALIRLTAQRHGVARALNNEFGTPINAVIGFSELLLEGKAGPLTATQEDYARAIHEGGQRLLSLVLRCADLLKRGEPSVARVLADPQEGGTNTS